MDVGIAVLQASPLQETILALFHLQGSLGLLTVTAQVHSFLQLF